MKKSTSTIITLLATIALITMIGFTSSCGLAARQAYGLAERVTDPDKILGDYHWFEDQYGVITATEANITTKQAEFVSMPEGDAKERVRVELSGMKSIYSRYVQEYNSRSRHIDRMLLKSKSLPEQITPATF